MKIAIMGFGTVGSGVKEVLELNREQVEKKGGDKIEIKYILARREHIPGVPDELITTDFSVIEKVSILLMNISCVVWKKGSM